MIHTTVITKSRSDCDKWRMMAKKSTVPATSKLPVPASAALGPSLHRNLTGLGIRFLPSALAVLVFFAIHPTYLYRHPLTRINVADCGKRRPWVNCVFCRL